MCNNQTDKRDDRNNCISLNFKVNRNLGSGIAAWWANTQVAMTSSNTEVSY